MKPDSARGWISGWVSRAAGSAAGSGLGQRRARRLQAQSNISMATGFNRAGERCAHAIRRIRAGDSLPSGMLAASARARVAWPTAARSCAAAAAAAALGLPSRQILSHHTCRPIGGGGGTGDDDGFPWASAVGLPRRARPFSTGSILPADLLRQNILRKQLDRADEKQSKAIAYQEQQRRKREGLGNVHAADGTPVPPPW